MYTICKEELQASYVMYGILWKEMDFDFMVGCKRDKFRKEIQSLLEMNAEFLDNLEAPSCSGMLPITSADTKVKQTNKKKALLTCPKPCYFFRGMLLTERKVSFKRRKRSKLCPGPAIPLLAYPQHKKRGV